MIPSTPAVRMSSLAPSVDILLNDVLEKELDIQRTIYNLVEWDKLMKQFQTQAAIATIPEPDTVTRTLASQEQAPGVMLGGTLAGSNSEIAYWDLIGRNAPAEFRAVPCPSEEVVDILVIGDSSCAMVEEPNNKFPTKHHVAELLQAEQLKGVRNIYQGMDWGKGLDAS